MMDGGLAAREPFILRDRLHGSIVSINESGRFFVRLAGEAPLLASLLTKMNDKLNAQRAAVGPFSVLVAGNIVVSHYADGNWYRAQVLAADTAARTARLFFVDSGNVEVQPFDSVRGLPRELRAWPPFAVACSLSGAQRLAAWTPDDTALFRKLLVDDAAGAPFTFVVMKTAAVTEVEIYEKNGDNVGKRFLKEAEWRRVSRPLSHTAAAFTPAALSYAVPIAQPSHRTRKPAAALVRLLAVDLTQLRFAAVAAETLTQRRHSVVISFVASPSDLWLRLSDDGENRLRLLEQRLQHYLAQSAPPVEPFGWQRRQPCAALFALDGRWHRATLLDTPAAGSPGKVCAPLKRRERRWRQVVFVDYGNEESVKADELRPLPTEFITMAPALAIRCQLVGIKPPDGHWWSMAAADFLDTKLETVPFSANFLTRVDGGRFRVELTQMASTPAQRPLSLSQQLISRRLAAASPPPVSSVVSAPSAIARSIPVDIPIERPAAEPTPPPPPQPPPLPVVLPAQPVAHKRTNIGFPPLKLTIGQQLGSVAFIFAEGPLNMWLQASICEDELVKVDKVCQRVNDEPHEALELPLARGDVCVAYFADDSHWYRAEVVGDGGAEGVAVRFVDFGNDAVCKADEVRRLPDSAVVRDTPQLGIHCKLAGGVEPVDTWTDADNETLQVGGVWSPVAEWQPPFWTLVDGALGSVFGVDESDGLVVVSLKRDYGFSVADALLEKGIVKPEQSGVHYGLIEAVVSPTESVFKISGLPELAIPAGLGDKLHVTVCNVRNADRVFVHLRTDSKVLLLLHYKILAHFNGPCSRYKLVKPARGDLCAVKYTEGRKFGAWWFRAMVTGRSSPKLVQLYLVDIGDDLEAAVDEVYELGAELFIEPPQAIRLSLNGAAASCSADQLRAKLQSKSAVVQLQKSLSSGDGFYATVTEDASETPKAQRG